MNKEDRYVTACYGTIADQTTLMESPTGFRMRVDRRDVYYYESELHWVRVPKQLPA